MSKPKKNGERRKVDLNISNEDFESPVIFKKFKPSNNKTHSKTMKRKNPNSTKQLTLHQVYNENFRYSDMNSDHLQLALALSRSTSEMFNDHSSNEDFPLTLVKERGKKTLLEFGFKINKPQISVCNKIFKREPPKINKKSKFRFVTPILMMRTDEERESLIQSKLASLFVKNGIHPVPYEQSTPYVGNQDLERMRCSDCPIFSLNRRVGLLEDRDFLLPQLGMPCSRAKIDFLLRDWRQIALRDDSPPPSNEVSLEDGEGIPKIDCDEEISEIFKAENNLVKQKSIANHSSTHTIRLEVPQCEGIFENMNPSKYVYQAVSPDLFDNDVSLSKEYDETNQKLDTVLIQHHKVDSGDENIFPSIDKSVLDQECELDSEQKAYLNVQDVSSIENSCNNECDDLQIHYEQYLNNMSRRNFTKVENKDKSLNDNINTEKSISSSSRDDSLEEMPPNTTSILISEEDIVNLTFDEEDFTLLKSESSTSFFDKEKCLGASSLGDSCNEIERKLSDKVSYESSKIESYKVCTNPHLNKKTSKIFSSEYGESVSILDNVDYNQHEDYQISTNTYNQERRHSLETVCETNNKSIINIIYSSDEESHLDNRNDKLFELQRSNEKYTDTKTNSLYHDQTSIGKSNLLEIQNSPSRRLTGYNDNLKFKEFNVENEELYIKYSLESNISPQNELVEQYIQGSSHKLHDTETSEQWKTQSFDNLKVDDTSQKYSDNMEEDNFESEIIEKHNDLETESRASHASGDSNDGIISFPNNKSSQNNVYTPDADTSCVFFSHHSPLDELNFNEAIYETPKQQSCETFINEYAINFSNITEKSKFNLVHNSAQKLKKVFNTPLRRCTSFDENTTPTTKIDYARHKSESNITPNKKICIKTENITPMLNYNALSTPDIVKELEKFGLKPLKRKRGINLLKHIYETTHPILESHQKKAEEMPTVKRRKSHIEDAERIESNTKITAMKVMKRWTGTILESEAIFERQRSKIFTCQVPLQIIWFNFLNKNPGILQNILLYEPLQVEVIHGMLKEEGYKFHIQDLITFLDHKCITIRVNQGKVG